MIQNQNLTTLFVLVVLLVFYFFQIFQRVKLVYLFRSVKYHFRNILTPYSSDDLGISGKGWASYDMSSHILSPIPGRILVFRTYDNKYAKMEIVYYYDSPDPQPSEGDYGGFYTFNYVYQSDGTINL